MSLTSIAKALRREETVDVEAIVVEIAAAAEDVREAVEVDGEDAVDVDGMAVVAMAGMVVTAAGETGTSHGFARIVTDKHQEPAASVAALFLLVFSKILLFRG